MCNTYTEDTPPKCYIKFSKEHWRVDEIWFVVSEV